MDSTRALAHLGDLSSTGGHIITASPHKDFSGKHIAREGDQVTCPKCGTIGYITCASLPLMTCDDVPVARAGDYVCCACPSFSVTLLQAKGKVSMIGDQAPDIGAATPDDSLLWELSIDISTFGLALVTGGSAVYSLAKAAEMTEEEEKEEEGRELGETILENRITENSEPKDDAPDTNSDADVGGNSTDDALARDRMKKVWDKKDLKKFEEANKNKAKQRKLDAEKK